MFNLLTLVWLELGLLDMLDLLVGKLVFLLAWFALAGLRSLLACFALAGLRRLRLACSLTKVASLARTMLDLLDLLDLRDCAWLAHSPSSLRSHGPNLTWLGAYSRRLACSTWLRCVTR